MFGITEKNITNSNIIQQSNNSTTNMISHNITPKLHHQKNYFGVKSTSTVTLPPENLFSREVSAQNDSHRNAIYLP